MSESAFRPEWWELAPPATCTCGHPRADHCGCGRVCLARARPACGCRGFLQKRNRVPALPRLVLDGVELTQDLAGDYLEVS